MTTLRRWKTGTATLLAMAITTTAVAPMTILAPANAQFNIGQSRNVSIPAGVVIPLTFNKDKVVVAPDETTSLTLTVARDIVDSNRNVLIPTGTEVIGQLVPVKTNGQKGTRFVARELRFANGQTQPINANSRIVTTKETIRKGANTGTILQDAAIGAGAATLISLVTGNKRAELGTILGGGGLGALASILLRRREAEVIVIDPQRDLNITLRSNLLVSRNYNY
jgi:hypothetical protein